MKLMLPDVLRHLTEKTVALLPPNGRVTLVKPKHKLHTELVRPLLADIHRAEKFIFDSGSDQDDETGAAVRSTAAEMIEFGIFHLPAPVIWIEDPFTNIPGPPSRNYYLCYEVGEEIQIQFFQGLRPNTVPQFPQYIMLTNFMAFSTTNPSGAYVFATSGAEAFVEPVERHMKEVVYAVIKFIVTLATPQTIRERVEAARARSGKAGRRDYEHTIIRVPSYVPEPGPGEAQGTQGKRRMGLVAGYVWGKNTRPVAEQRWIAPHWRGDASVGVVPPKVRVVDPRPVG